MSKHTPEPWELHGPYRDGGYEFRGKTDGEEPKRLARTYSDKSTFYIGEAKANGERMLSCVNALAGIADPFTFVAAVRSAVASGAVDEIHLSILRDELGESK